MFGNGLLKLEGKVKEEREWLRGKKYREREIYIFVFQIKEKVYLESLNSFCEVKKLSENKTLQQ